MKTRNDTLVGLENHQDNTTEESLGGERMDCESPINNEMGGGGEGGVITSQNVNESTADGRVDSGLRRTVVQE